MKFVLWTTLLASLVLSACQQKEQKLTPNTTEEKYAYAVGADMARMQKHTLDRITSVEKDFDVDMYLQGLRDALKGELQFDEKTIQQISNDYRKRFVAEQKAERERMATENKAAAEKFLSENRNKEGVIETESGLQYQIIKEGEGKQPTEDDRIQLNYDGTLLDGTVFDSTKKRGKPAEFEINQLKRMVPGWAEGLQLMKEGGKFKFFIPPALGYGERGHGNIPPNAVLIIEVELIKVIDKENKTKE